MADTETQILVALMRGPEKGMTTGQLVEATGRSYSAIRNHLRVLCLQLRPPWVEKMGRDPKVRAVQPSGVYYRLTERGREVARGRARTAANRG